MFDKRPTYTTPNLPVVCMKNLIWNFYSIFIKSII